MARPERIRLDVPYALKRRMELFTGGGKVNWSAVACKAFEAELVRLEASYAVPAAPVATDSPEVAAAVRNLADAAAHLARVLSPDRS